jgi:hypothetical protein
MKRLVFVALALSVFAPAVRAEEGDICKSLMKQAEAGLKANQLHDIVRDRLREMFDVGRRGNILNCLDVANGALASPKVENKCNEKPAV